MQKRPPVQQAETMESELQPSTEADILELEPRMGYSENSDEGIQRIIEREKIQDDPEQTLRDFVAEDYGDLFLNFLDRHIGSLTEHSSQDLRTAVKRLQRTATQLEEFNYQNPELVQNAFFLFKKIGEFV